MSQPHSRLENTPLDNLALRRCTRRQGRGAAARFDAASIERLTHARAHLGSDLQAVWRYVGYLVDGIILSGQVLKPSKKTRERRRNAGRTRGIAERSGERTNYGRIHGLVRIRV